MKKIVIILFLINGYHSNAQSNDKSTMNKNINPIKSDTLVENKAAEKGGSSFPSGEQFKGANITYNIIPAANNTFCYDILMEGRLFIHQPSAPGLPGNEGFKTEEAAKKVAELVVSKMKRGEMPPSITIEEMKEIKALD